MGFEVLPGCHLRAVFERPDSGGACRDDTPSLLLCVVDRVGRLSRQRISLGMQLHVSHLFDTQWLECPQAYVKSEMADLHAACSNLIKDGGREVKARSRYCDRTAMLREDSLVAIAVITVIGVANIGRQWYVAEGFEGAEEILCGSEAQYAFSKLAALDDVCLENFASTIDDAWNESQTLPYLHFPAWLGQSLPLPRGNLFRKENFDPARLPWLTRITTGSLREQPRRNHAAVIQNEKIAGSQELRESREGLVAP